MELNEAETVEVETETPEVNEAETHDTPEASASDDMGDIYDRMTGDGRERDESGRFKAKDGAEEAEEAPETTGEEAQEDAELDADTDAPEVEEVDQPAIDSPSYLPQEVRDHWKDIPEAARNAFAKSQQDMSAKLAEMGRRAVGFEPVAGAVTSAIKDFPELANMTPEAVAKDAYELAHTRANLQRDPVGTVMKLAQQMGFMDQLAGRMNGTMPQQPQQGDPQREIAALRKELQDTNNPAKMQEAIQQEMAARESNKVVSDFAQGKEHWGLIEPILTRYIPAAQQTQGEGASDLDVLTAAYDMAMNANGLKATATTPAKAVVQPTPKRTEAVIKAKSANVTSRSSKPSPKSDRDSMGDVWDKVASR